MTFNKYEVPFKNICLNTYIDSSISASRLMIYNFEIDIVIKERQFGCFHLLIIIIMTLFVCVLNYSRSNTSECAVIFGNELFSADVSLHNCEQFNTNASHVRSQFIQQFFWITARTATYPSYK